jgi:hypothetical protein
MQMILCTLVEIIVLPNISWRIRTNSEKAPIKFLMSFRMHQCRFHLKNFYKNLLSGTFTKICRGTPYLVKIATKARTLHNYGYIVQSAKYFVTLQQCKGKPLLCFHGKNRDSLLLTDRSRSTTIRMKVSLLLPWQQWLRERVTILHFTWISFLVIILISRLTWPRLEVIPLTFYRGDHEICLHFSDVT